MNPTGWPHRPHSLRSIAVAVAGLALGCLGLAPPAADVVLDFEPLPLYRVDVQKPDPTSAHPERPAGFYRVSEKARGVAQRFETNTQGHLRLPPIPIVLELHEKLFDSSVLGEGLGLKCRLGPGTGLIRRGGDGKNREDLIPLGASAPGDREAGWIEVAAPELLSSGGPGEIGLTIYNWRSIVRAVGAGIFAGEVQLLLTNDRIHDGATIRISQPIQLVIAGGRVLPIRAVSPSRVGEKTAVRVDIEEVELDEKAAKALDEGWWLRAEDAANSSPLVRLPLPMREERAKDVVFAGPDDPGKGPGNPVENWAWDTIRTPREVGYDLTDDWRNDLILQQWRRGEDTSGLPEVRVHRHSITSYLPPWSRPGSFRVSASWDPSTDGRSPKYSPPRAGVDSPVGRSTGSVRVGSGLLVTPDLPLPDEPIRVTARIESPTAVAANAPEFLAAELWKVDADTGRPDFIKWITLVKEDSSEDSPRLALYTTNTGEKTDLVEPGESPQARPGTYQVRLNYGDDPSRGALERPPAAGKPPDAWESLRDLKVRVRSVVEGGMPSSSSEEIPFADPPIKVFLDGQPLWWILVDAGYSGPKYNERFSDEFATRTIGATAFRLARGSGVRNLGLRYSGIYDGFQAYGGVAPNPKVSILKWDGKWEGNGSTRNCPPIGAETLPIPGGDGESRLLLEIEANITDLSPEQRQAQRAEPNQALHVARFDLIGLEEDGTPIGRIYQRPFRVAVRSFWDELWDVINYEYFLFGVGVLTIGTIVLVRRHVKNKAKRLARERAAAAIAATEAVDEGPRTQAVPKQDYFSGLDPDPDHDRPPGPAKPPPPAAKPTPPSPGPSYFDDHGSGESAGPGDSYFD